MEDEYSATDSEPAREITNRPTIATDNTISDAKDRTLGKLARRFACLNTVSADIDRKTAPSSEINMTSCPLLSANELTTMDNASNEATIPKGKRSPKNWVYAHNKRKTRQTTKLFGRRRVNMSGAMPLAANSQNEAHINAMAADHNFKGDSFDLSKVPSTENAMIAMERLNSPMQKRKVLGSMTMKLFRF